MVSLGGRGADWEEAQGNLPGSWLETVCVSIGGVAGERSSYACALRCKLCLNFNRKRENVGPAGAQRGPSLSANPTQPSGSRVSSELGRWRPGREMAGSLPEFLRQQAWGGAQEFAFRTLPSAHPQAPAKSWSAGRVPRMLRGRCPWRVQKICKGYTSRSWGKSMGAQRSLPWGCRLGGGDI